MSEFKSLPSWLRYLLRLSLIAVLVYIVWLVREVLMILLLGVLLAYALRPMVVLLEGMGTRGKVLSRGTAVALVFIIVAAILWLLAISLLPPLGQEIAELREKFPEQRQNFAEVWQTGVLFFEMNFPESVKDTIKESTEKYQTLAINKVEEIVGASFRGLGLIAELLLVPILAFYFLTDTSALRRQITFFIPPQHHAICSRAFDGLNQIMYRYVMGQLILCLVAFAVVSVGLWALGIKFWLLLGILAGITRAIPIIGPLIGGIPVVAAVLAQSQSVPFGLWVTIGFILLHLFESKYLMPAILGRQLDIHPVLIILALLLGAQFLGLIGMFIAVPVLAAIKFFIADYREHCAEEAGTASA